jgi:hypothetical protein
MEIENLKSNKHVIFSDAPPMIRQKSWDDTNFLKENYWGKPYFDEQKSKMKKKSKTKNSTRDERRTLRKLYKKTMLESMNNSELLSQPNTDLLNKLLEQQEKKEKENQELLNEELMDEEYMEQLFLKNQQIREKIREKEEQEKLRQTEKERKKEPINLKNKGKWHKVKKTFKRLFGKGGKKKTRKIRKIRTKIRK